jgi:dihydrofolate reductase
MGFMAASKQQPATKSRAKTARTVRRKKTAETKPLKPQVRVALAVSLDGYIADKRGGVKWLDAYFSPEMDFAGFMAMIGVSVMGRKTFEVALKLGMPPGEADQRNIVLSSKPPRNAPAGFEHFRGDLRRLVATLKQDLAGTGKDIWLMGGGEVIEAFRKAGLVDRWELSVIPIVLGDGIPLFPKRKYAEQTLRLVHTRAFGNGVVELWYEPAQ